MTIERFFGSLWEVIAAIAIVIVMVLFGAIVFPVEVIQEYRWNIRQRKKKEAKNEMD